MNGLRFFHLIIHWQKNLLCVITAVFMILEKYNIGKCVDEAVLALLREGSSPYVSKSLNMQKRLGFNYWIILL